MNLVFITEARYTKNKNGEIYYENSSFAYQLWENYLDVFDEIIVVARVNEDENHDETKAFIATGNRVKFIELPYFIGAKDYILHFSKMKKAMMQITTIANAAYLCRVPGNIGHTAIKILKKNNIPYGVEVVGDPWDVFSVIVHPLKKIIRKISYDRLVFDVKNAAASLFVTEKYLQKRYQPHTGAFTTAVSDVIVNEDDFFPRESRTFQSSDKFNILSIGSLEQMYKSPDVLLKSISVVIKQGYNVQLDWLGDGLYKNQMIQLAKDLGIENHVNFHGNVGKEEVKDHLRKANIFVLISRTEGLPRAMIEAMAASLPCIGSRVGGIPELIDEECLVEVSNIKDTSELIIKFISNNSFLQKHSEINFLNSKNFERQVLAQKRKLFLETLKSNIK